MNTSPLLRTYRWAYLGLGFTMQERNPGSDIAPYLSEEAIDPKWLNEVIKKGASVVEQKRE